MKISMNAIVFASLISAFIVGLSSCGDIQQDLRLNKDGSGSLETMIDAGELMGMAKEFETIGSDQDTFSDDMVPDTIVTDTAAKDPMQSLMEKITDPNYGRDFDTIMSLVSIMPDSVREKETRLDLCEKIFVRLKSKANSANMAFGFLMMFDNTEHLQELINYVENLNQSSGMMSGSAPVNMDSETFITFDANMTEGWIRIDTVKYSGFAQQMGMSQDTSVSSEDMGMMEMLFGNSKIKSVIHVPGEVISCTNPDAILTKDNKVMVEFPMMDVIRKGRIDGYTIYFKP